MCSRGQEAIRRRLTELDQEWDVERALEANAATAALLGLTLGATVDRKWFLFPAFVAGFLLQHAVFGWCPPLPVMRRLGFRTRCEIEQERYALKALRVTFKMSNQSMCKKINMLWYKRSKRLVAKDDCGCQVWVH